MHDVGERDEPGAIGEQCRHEDPHQVQRGVVIAEPVVIGGAVVYEHHPPPAARMAAAYRAAQSYGLVPARQQAPACSSTSHSTGPTVLAARAASSVSACATSSDQAR